MSLALKLIFAVLLIVALGTYFSVLSEVRSRLPPALKSPIAARFALDLYVWGDNIPKSVRRKYLVYLGSSTSVVIYIAAILLWNDIFIAGLLLGLMALAFFANLVLCVTKYRKSS